MNSWFEYNGRYYNLDNAITMGYNPDGLRTAVVIEFVNGSVKIVTTKPDGFDAQSLIEDILAGKYAVVCEEEDDE